LPASKKWCFKTMSEHKEQEALFEWAQYIKVGGRPLREYMWAIENGGSRHPIEARNLKRRGVTPGVPDVFIACPRGALHGMFIEMKRKDGGKVSKAQQEMHGRLLSKGYDVRVCHGWDMARKCIEEYLVCFHN
jgi:hypothetical protein